MLAVSGRGQEAGRAAEFVRQLFQEAVEPVEHPIADRRCFSRGATQITGTNFACPHQEARQERRVDCDDQRLSLFKPAVAVSCLARAPRGIALSRLSCRAKSAIARLTAIGADLASVGVSLIASLFGYWAPPPNRGY
jgi:hypothetical protein